MSKRPRSDEDSDRTVPPRPGYDPNLPPEPETTQGALQHSTIRAPGPADVSVITTRMIQVTNQQPAVSIVDPVIGMEHTNAFDERLRMDTARQEFQPQSTKVHPLPSCGNGTLTSPFLSSVTTPLASETSPMSHYFSGATTLPLRMKSTGEQEQPNESCIIFPESEIYISDPHLEVPQPAFDWDSRTTFDMEVEEYFDAVDRYPDEDLSIADAARGEETPSFDETFGFESETSSSFFNEPLPSMEKPTVDPLLYEGAAISVSDAATALLSFMLQNKLSGQALSATISLIQLLLPSDNKFFSTLYSFHKYFENMQSSFNFIYYCSLCFQPLDSMSDVCNQCGPATKVSYYLHMPIVDQIRDLYSRPGFIEHLSYRYSRSRTNVNNLEDIFDGSLYTSYASGPLAGPLNISFMWNTDGISLYKSSSYQIWPFFLVVNELPPHLRHKNENVILAGLAFGYEKPKPNLLLKPIKDELTVLENGIEVKIPDRETPEVVKCALLCGTCDAPAKSLFTRMSNFNGFYGCCKCYARGEKSVDSGNVFVYRFDGNLEPRTKDRYENDLMSSQNGQDPESSHGVKGPTHLFKMSKNFFLTSIAVDVMHNVYLGLCRQIFFLWLHSDFIKLVFGETTDRKTLTEKLSKLFCDLEPPHYLSRPPRSLKHLKYFKASEFRTWLFCHALPTLQQYMKEPYLSHFKKLVWGIALLNKASVSEADLALSKDLLFSFVMQWQELFGLRHMSFNLHCLLHLPDVVSYLGPLWVTSCFKFENLNGFLATLVHGTRHAGLQIQTNVSLLRKIPALINSIQNVFVKKFCSDAMTSGKKLCITGRICERTLLVGKVTNQHELPKELQNMLSQFAAGMCVQYFFRLKRNGHFYVSEMYGRGKRNSSCVLYNHANQKYVGTIKFFLVLSSCNNCDCDCNHPKTYHAVVERFSTSYPFQLNHNSQIIVLSMLLSCSFSGLVDIIPIDCLNCVCFRMNIGESIYVSVPLNDRELE